MKTGIPPRVFTGLLGVVLFSQAQAQQGDWYLGAGLGMNEAGAFNQAGFNDDTLCYPAFVCDGAHSGFRWFYDLESDSGMALELAAGRAWNDWRAEIALARLDNGIVQRFTGIEFLNGNPVRFIEQNDYRISTRASAGDLLIHSLAFNMYRDFPGAGGWTPYLGAGIGAARAELTELYFEERYACISEACQGRPSGEFDSLQLADLGDTVYTAQLFAGADFDLANNLKLGLKLAWRHVDEFSAVDSYLEHAPPSQTNTNSFSNTSHWSLVVELKRFFFE